MPYHRSSVIYHRIEYKYRLLNRPKRTIPCIYQGNVGLLKSDLIVYDRMRTETDINESEITGYLNECTHFHEANLCE